jgi:hypothetical protein
VGVGLGHSASTELDVPVTFGRAFCFLRVVGLGDFKRDAILVHETSHVRRRDFYATAGWIHRAVFWFSPLAWWLQAQLLKASENACDDEAIKKVGPHLLCGILLNTTKLVKRSSMGVAMARGKLLD